MNVWAVLSVHYLPLYVLISAASQIILKQNSKLCLYFTVETQKTLLTVCLSKRYLPLWLSPQVTFVTLWVWLMFDFWTLFVCHQEEGEINTTPKVSACSTPGECQSEPAVPVWRHQQQQELICIFLTQATRIQVSINPLTNLLYFTVIGCHT